MYSGTKCATQSYKTVNKSHPFLASLLLPEVFFSAVGDTLLLPVDAFASRKNSYSGCPSEQTPETVIVSTAPASQSATVTTTLDDRSDMLIRAGIEVPKKQSPYGWGHASVLLPNGEQDIDVVVVFVRSGWKALVPGAGPFVARIQLKVLLEAGMAYRVKADVRGKTSVAWLERDSGEKVTAEASAPYKLEAGNSAVGGQAAGYAIEALFHIH
jgi:hypothetical protein